MSLQVQTGSGAIPVTRLVAIWSISALNALPGLAVSPILGKLSQIFPTASEVEIQMLSSLPSLMIIPFILFSGRLSLKVKPLTLLQTGLAIFALSGVLYLLADTMRELVLISALLGVGSGLIVPLSTGLISDLFSGPYRTKQMGISSGVTNITLVIVTFVTGWLAQYHWKAPFAVYLLPLVSMWLIYRYMPNERKIHGAARNAAATAPDPGSFGRHGIRINPLVQLMLFYGGATYLALAIPLSLPFLMQEYGLSSENAGTIISLFFLAIMAPGFFLNGLLRITGKRTKLVTLLSIAVGLLLVVASHSQWLMAAGALLCGLGYGVIQPLTYDETARIATPAKATLALAFVMAMNYVAILLTPEINYLVKSLAHTHSERFTFFFDLSLTALLAGAAWFCPNLFAFRLNSDPTTRSENN